MSLMSDIEAGISQISPGLANLAYPNFETITGQQVYVSPANASKPLSDWMSDFGTTTAPGQSGINSGGSLESGLSAFLAGLGSGASGLGSGAGAGLASLGAGAGAGAAGVGSAADKAGTASELAGIASIFGGVGGGALLLAGAAVVGIVALKLMK